MAVSGEHYENAARVARTHGLGHLALEDDLAVARVRYYLDPLPEHLETVFTIAGEAERMGHSTVEAEAHLLACMSLYDLGRYDLVLRHFDVVRDLAQRHGALPVEAPLASFAARALSELEQREAIKETLGNALHAVREQGMAEHGGTVLGAVVLLARGSRTRESAFAEAGEILDDGASSHGHLRFYRDAIDASLAIGDHQRAGRFAGLLAEYTSVEPLPWADFYAARGRALATTVAGRGDSTTVRDLRQLLAQAKRLGYVWAQTAMRAALDEIRRNPDPAARLSGLGAVRPLAADVRPAPGPGRKPL